MSAGKVEEMIYGKRKDMIEQKGEREDSGASAGFLHKSRG